MHTIRITFLTLLIASLASTAFAKGRGLREKVKWADVPEVVQITITERAAGGTVRSIEKRSRRGEVTYTADVKGANGKLTEIEVNSNGKFISLEEVDPDEADEHSD